MCIEVMGGRTGACPVRFKPKPDCSMLHIDIRSSTCLKVFVRQLVRISRIEVSCTAAPSRNPVWSGYGWKLSLLTYPGAGVVESPITKPIIVYAICIGRISLIGHFLPIGNPIVIRIVVVWICLVLILTQVIEAVAIGICIGIYTNVSKVCNLPCVGKSVTIHVRNKFACAIKGGATVVKR